MTRDEWAKFDGRVVVVDDHVCGGMIGRYRHSDGVLDPHSVRGDSTQAGAVPCSVIYGPWSASLWRPEVGETVRVVGPDLPIVVTSCTGKSVAGEFVPGDFWSAGLEHVEPAWFPERTASAPEPDKPSPPPIEAPEGWELVDSHWAWCDGEPEGYRAIRKGESVREERLELRDGEWRMVVSDPVERAEPEGDPAYVDHLRCMGFGASGLGVLRDGQWVQFMAADPPMRDGEVLWRRGAVPERADEEPKVAMVRGESSGKSEPTRTVHFSEIDVVAPCCRPGGACTGWCPRNGCRGGSGCGGGCGGGE